MPQRAAGPRIDPPVSDPIAPKTKPAATAAPEPLLDPPLKCSRFHGLRAGGQGRSNEGPPCANSWVESLPIRTPPAARSRAVAVASEPAILSIAVRECPVVGTPAAS